jgi:hypothetical protein
MNTRRLLCPLLVLLLSLTLVWGCGSKRPASSSVSGQVTYNGAPVTGGSITFHSPDSGVYPSSIDAKGNYNVADLPDGELVVTIETESRNTNKQVPIYDARSGSSGAKMVRLYGQTAGGGGGGSKEGAPPKDMKTKSPAGESAPQGDAGEYVKIPEKYGQKKTSPLKVTIKSGQQSQNFELTD